MQVSKIAVSNQFSANQNQKVNVNKNNPNFGLILKGDGITPKNRAIISQKMAAFYAKTVRQALNNYPIPDYKNLAKHFGLVVEVDRTSAGVSAKVSKKGYTSRGVGISNNHNRRKALEEASRQAIDSFVLSRVMDLPLDDFRIAA